MKNAYLAPVALLIVAACSQPSGTDATSTAMSVAPGNAAHAAEVAANTRRDGSVIDESKPHAHSAANAHNKPMDHMATMTPQPDDSAATKGYKQSMSRMMRSMPPYTGDADIDFNKQMRIHHLAAIDMGEVQLANGKDADSRALAAKIIADQKREVAQIDAWLAKRGQ